MLPSIIARMMKTEATGENFCSRRQVEYAVCDTSCMSIV